MVEFDCGHCEIPLQPTASAFGETLVGDDSSGAYPARFLTCPGCGACWEQRPSGTLTNRVQGLPARA